MGLDDVIGLVSPRAAYQRSAWREARAQLEGTRSYALANRGRKNADWRASWGSGDSEVFNDLSIMRARSRQMIRDNPYIASGHRNLTAALSGITGRAVHSDPRIAALAQSIWEEKAREPVDLEERNDFYGNQRIAISAAISDGDAFLLWRPFKGSPNGRVQLIEGEQVDSLQNFIASNGNRIVMGVEYDKNTGQRVAYHMFDHHPGDQLAWLGVKTIRVDAADVDHLFERTRISGGARGVPWFHAGLIPTREIGEVAEARRIQQRIQACLSIFRRPGDSGANAPLGQQKAQDQGPAWEKLSPGMIVNGQPGEEISVISPSVVNDEGFLRSQVMGAAAGCGVPYFIFSGDVSQANFSSQRADMVAYWLRQDDWTHHTIVPGYCRPWARRQMQVSALKFGEPELLNVRFDWTPQPRPFVNPIQDVTAELIEIRSGLTSYLQALAARGLDARVVLEQIANINKLIDEKQVVLDSDPRRTTDQGIIQNPVGYLSSKATAVQTPPAA